jgi:hypothetical protein
MSNAGTRKSAPTNKIRQMRIISLVIPLNVDVVSFIDNLVGGLKRSTEPACQPIDVSWRIEVDCQRVVVSGPWHVDVVVERGDDKLLTCDLAP